MVNWQVNNIDQLKVLVLNLNLSHYIFDLVKVAISGGARSFYVLS